MNSFNEFGLTEPILRALVQENYVTPTPIQAQTIPSALGGRDIVGIAQTGTGKTAAFALPILHQLAATPHRPERKACRVLVLSPTRELSGQILDSFKAYGRHLGLSATLAKRSRPEARIDIPRHEWQRDMDRTHRRVDRILRRTPRRAAAAQPTPSSRTIHG